MAVAALTGPLPKAGVVVLAILAAGALLARDDRRRALAVFGALAVSPALLLASLWHDRKLHFVHHHPLLAVVAAIVALAIVGALALVVNRFPAVLGALAVLALPFRVSVAGSNLLVPLYFVIAAGALRFGFQALRGPGGEFPRPPDDGRASPLFSWLERLLALYVVLYAFQSLYSSGFETALKNVVFFYVPFTLLYCLLARLQWTPRLIRTSLWLVAAMAMVLAGVAYFEYATRTTLFSSKLAYENELYVYFVANSVFYDPNIFGRFLALVMVVLAVVLLYDRPWRVQLAASAALVVLWGALFISFSRSSMIALVVGLAVIAAMRWRPRAPLALGAVVVVLAGVAVAVEPTTFGLNQGANGVSAGRGSLLSGGVQLFEGRPIQGFGSGSFEHEYRLHNPRGGSTTASHTIPVTVAAEQGVIGEFAYIALVLVAIAALGRGARSDPARVAIAAAFVALLVHTMLYADFLEDPSTWALLGIGVALGRARSAGGALKPVSSTRVAAAVSSPTESVSGAIHAGTE